MNVANSLFQSDAEVRNLLGDFIVSRQTDGHYLERLVIIWNEKQGSVAQPQIIKHTFAMGIDRKNQVYIDCSKWLIYVKILGSTLFRPIHATILVGYQLSMIPIFNAISSAYSKEITASEAFRRSFRSIAEIVRVPLYELAMVVSGCTALLVAPFAPTTLYRFRELIGKIEKAMFYGLFRHKFCLTPCFQPRSLRELVDEFGFAKRRDGEFVLVRFQDTEYPTSAQYTDAIIDSYFSHDNRGNIYVNRGNIGDVNQSETRQDFQRLAMMRGLIHYGRSLVRHIRNCETPPLNREYRSVALEKISPTERDRAITLWKNNFEYDCIPRSQSGG